LEDVANSMHNFSQLFGRTTEEGWEVQVD